MIINLLCYVINLLCYVVINRGCMQDRMAGAASCDANDIPLLGRCSQPPKVIKFDTDMRSLDSAVCASLCWQRA